MLALHIGLPRAGSSAIQYCLANQAEALTQAGLHYALEPALATRQANRVSSGNGLELARYLDPRRRPEGFSPERFEHDFDSTFVSPAQPVSLISSELCSAVSKSMLTRFRDAVVVGRPLRVVAVARNLYDHAFSCWSQTVKRQAYSHSFRRYVAELYDNPQCRSLRAYGKAFGYESLRVIHYDSVEDRLFSAFLQALDFDPSATEPPRINRGLTRAELKVQLAFNRIHGNRLMARAISDRFVGRRPDLPGDCMWDPEVAAMLEQRFGHELRRINRLVFDGRQLLSVTGERPRAEPPPKEPRTWIVAEAAQAALTHAASRVLPGLGRGQDQGSAPV